jgi:dolichyl-phosphate beta-glucosyltransferase
MKAREPQITVIVPAYNEGGRIAPTLREIGSFLGNEGYEYELIVVDDGSSDGTYDVAHYITGEIPHLSIVRHPKNLGKGMAVKSGFLAAAGRLVFFTDADHSTPIQELPKFVAHVHDGYDVVIGSRALPGSVITERQRWYRENMGRAFNLLVRLLVVRGFYDTQCGFKCFVRDRCGEVFRKQALGGFCFDVELIYLAKRQGLRIAEIPVTWRNSADTRVHTLKDSLRMFRDLLRIRCRAIRGKYGPA